MTLSVFTYGTLQIPSVIEAVTGRKFKSEPAVLENFVRFRIKNQVYPGIIPKENASIDGMIYFDLDERSLGFLDAFEDVLYVRTQDVVICNNNKIPAMVYVVDRQHRDLLSDEPWDIESFKRNHLDSYLESCRKFHREYKNTF